MDLILFSYVHPMLPRKYWPRHLTQLARAIEDRGRELALDVRVRVDRFDSAHELSVWIPDDVVVEEQREHGGG